MGIKESARSCIGLNKIGDDIPGSKCYVGIPALKQRFQLNMSKAQAKKCMLLALCYDKENSKTTNLINEFSTAESEAEKENMLLI